MSVPLTAAPPRRSILRLSRALGWLALGLSLGFLGLRIGASAPTALAGAPWPTIAAVTAIGGLVYGAAGLLLAEAWRRLLAPRTGRAPMLVYHRVYARTQIAKYLPGNCFHLVGRHVLGHRLGHDHRTLALAALAETVLLLTVASALALPSAWSSMHELAGRSIGLPLDLAGWTIAAAIPVVAALTWRAAARRGVLVVPAADLLTAALLQAAFFAVAGAVLWRLASALGPSDVAPPGLAASISALALAWTAGFVTPGAAAGIGVREAVLILAVEPYVSSEAALLTAVTMRLVTTLGDGLLFALSLRGTLHHSAQNREVRQHSSVLDDQETTVNSQKP